MIVRSHILFGVSALIYSVFWIWAMLHAWATPKASLAQRLYWVGAMIVNPTTPIWYWYIWKRWAFWTLFTPVLGTFVSFPFVVRSVLSHAAATNLTNTLFALGTSRLVILMAFLLIFPIILRLRALLHLGRNTELSAMDRNDWVVSFAFPIFGFGAGLAYCAQYLRRWAIVSLAWWLCLSLSSRFMIPNVVRALIPAGEDAREKIQHD